MAWKALDRQSPAIDQDAPDVLGEAVKDKIGSLLPRYATKQAALLPALHIVQDALGHVPLKAQLEIAELLELRPVQVADTLSFYTHYWTHPKGRKVVVVCRSISCQLMGAEDLLQAVKDHLKIDEHGTTDDGEYSLITEECLAGCDHAPCMLVGERLHRCVKSQDVAAILDDPDSARVDGRRSDLFDAPSES
jgi:NADH:ubiquinone oxidoreductase subunit E